MLFRSERDIMDYRINYEHNKFGEVIFWADGGSMFFPNCYQDRHPVKAMHGYRSEVRDNHSSFIIYDTDRRYGIDIEKPVPMVDIFPTILDTLHLAYPEDMKATSIIKRAES